MKYIRTKDGIWLFGGTHHKGDVIIGKKQEIDFGYCFDKKDIIGEADTIRELIDEVVVSNPESDPHYSSQTFLAEKRTWDFFLSKAETEFAKEHGVKIRGAIWTDKGLIYVTKPVNEKGGLELL